MRQASNGNSDSSSEVMSSLQSVTVKVQNLKSEQSEHADEEDKEEESAVLSGYQSESSEAEASGCKLKRQKASKMINAILSHSDTEPEALSPA